MYLFLYFFSGRECEEGVRSKDKYFEKLNKALLQSYRNISGRRNMQTLLCFLFFSVARRLYLKSSSCIRNYAKYFHTLMDPL